jgi:hypothetical protein
MMKRRLNPSAPPVEMQLRSQELNFSQQGPSSFPPQHLIYNQNWQAPYWNGQQFVSAPVTVPLVYPYGNCTVQIENPKNQETK